MEKKSGKIIRVALTGPESTGKTSLASELAGHYNTVWVPEYAREYLEGTGHKYEEQDLLRIAKGQRRLEKNLIDKANRYIFCDTEMLVIKLWGLHKYGRVDEKIEKWIAKKPYHLYLLCYPDLQWASDPLRENPEGGDYFFKQFENELKRSGFDYEVIRGNGNERLMTAVDAIDNRFDK